jgi:O-antigen ligase
VLYLALRGGGYDTIVYSEAGLAVWWIVLLGALVGVMPLQRFRRIAWMTTGIFGGFLLWSLLASSWSSSAERTVAEVGRLATYAGFFVVALCALRRDTIRPLVGGMAAAFGLVSLLAVLSRLYPGAFPTDQIPQFFSHGASPRLSYPLNYASGDGNFFALGLPLLLAVSTRARALAVQALAAAAIPVTVLALVMTASRGGVLTAIVGIAVFYALAPDRVPKLATGLAIAIGSVILIGALLHRHDLREGLSTSLAVSQRHQLMVLVVLVCAGVALLQVAVGLIARYAHWPALRISRSGAQQLAAAGLVVVVIAGVAAGIPGKLEHQWNVFKETSTTGVVPGNTLSRLGTLSGSHRYQYWVTAVHAFEHRPIDGIGPGTYEFYWAQHGPIYEFIRNAHSLYLETLAETGLIGFLILAAFLLALLTVGVTRTLRAPPLARASLAAATAAFAAFLVSAGYDWMWQLSCAPVAALLLGAAIVSYRPTEVQRDDTERTRRRERWATRGAMSFAAVAAMVAIAIPFAMTSALRSSQSEVGNHDLKAALSDALTAQSLEPYAATPRLQEALVYEQAHDFTAARAAIVKAAAREPLNWRIWLVRSRIEAESGHPVEAVRDYKHAHVLDPRDTNVFG